MAQSGLALHLVWLVALWLSLAVHEWAHAWSAYRLGDDTAARLGRMTLDPLAHVDPVGTLLLPLLGVPFGWAKPVPVNPARFHRGVSLRTGIALTAAAGPMANLALVLIAVSALVAIGARNPAWVAAGAAPRLLLETIALLNLSLAIVNLLPVPPLDGSRVLEAWLPARLEPAWRSFLRAGVLVTFVWLGGPILFWPVEQMRSVLSSLLP